jgi:dipeptidyl aminopeptidase/acylaminoacyl peptidase
MLRAAPVACLLSSLAVPAAAQDAPRDPDAPRPAAEKRAYEIEDYYRTAMVDAPVVSPDAEHVVFTVRRYDLAGGKTWSELWAMEPDGSRQRQLTFGQDSIASPAFTPDAQAVVFASSRGGSQQLWSLRLDGGEARELTSLPVSFSDPVLSPDGRHAAVAVDVDPGCGDDLDCTKKRIEARTAGPLQVHVADELLYRHWTSWGDGLVTHVLLVDLETGEVVRDLTPGPHASPVFSIGGWPGYAFSPDGSELVFVSNRDAGAATSTNADLWLVQVLDGEGELAPAAEPRNLTADNDGWDGAPVWSPDGRSIAFLSQAVPGYESDLMRISVLDRASGAVRRLTSREGFDQMPHELRWSPDGSAIYFTADHEGRTPFFRVPAAGGEVRLVHTDAYVNGFDLVDDSGSIVYARRGIAEPPEICRVPLAGGRTERLTHFNDALADEVDLRPFEERWVEGEDGTRIHCFVVKPHGFDPDAQYPLILNVHGGPQGMWSDSYRGDWQVYPGKGYVVAFANPTGSTGYGQDFVDAIGCDWGGRVYRDLMRVTDALEAEPWIDGERMGAMGWSYGGYMMMWFQGHTTRFRCLAAMMGLYDLRSFYGATEELWFPERDLCGTPWDSEEYERWSPSAFTDAFATPSLVVTGELDYRVPYTQSLQYFTALRRRNIPARLVVYPGAGHWPAWHEMAFYYNAHLDWFHRWLGGEPAPWDVERHAGNRAFGAHAEEEDVAPPAEPDAPDAPEGPDRPDTPDRPEGSAVEAGSSGARAETQ